MDFVCNNCDEFYIDMSKHSPFWCRMSKVPIKTKYFKRPTWCHKRKKTKIRRNIDKKVLECLPGTILDIMKMFEEKDYSFSKNYVAKTLQQLRLLEKVKSEKKVNGYYYWEINEKKR